MAGLVFLFAVFGILSGLHSPVETENVETLKIEIPDGHCEAQVPDGHCEVDVPEGHCEIQVPDDLCRDVSFFSSINIVRLIMHPKNCFVPCDAEMKVCGIIMCVSETKGNSEDVGYGSQTSVGDAKKKRVLYEDKMCFCNNNEVELFVTQEETEGSDKRFVEYRVQEITDNDCKAVVCFWKLTVFTRLPSEYGGNPDVTSCINRNICKVVCSIRNSKFSQDAHDYTLLIMVLLSSALSVILTITFKHYTKTGRALFKLQGRDIETPQQMQYLSSSSESNIEDSEDSFNSDEENHAVDENSIYVHDRALQELFSAVDDADIMTYEAFRRQVLMRDNSPGREPAHLRHRMRL